MNFQLDENVWFGDWNSPMELKDKVKTIINVSHHFSVRKERNVYWKNLEYIPWTTFYVRLAKKDHDVVDERYFLCLESAITQAVLLDKLPMLCHCQMGAHRGPTAAVVAAWVLNGKTKKNLDFFVEKATSLRHRYARHVDTPYRKTMIELMMQHSS